MWPQLWNLPSSAVDSLCNLRLDLKFLTYNMAPAPRYLHCPQHHLSSFRGPQDLVSPTLANSQPNFRHVPPALVADILASFQFPSQDKSWPLGLKKCSFLVLSFTGFGSRPKYHRHWEAFSSPLAKQALAMCL